MTTKSDLFYDPFADRSDKLEGIDFKFAATTTDRDGKNGIGSGGSANEDESQHEDEQVVVTSFLFTAAFLRRFCDFFL